ncbi:F-box/LRR-repeat protein 15-like [Haliotis rufescens]|uniref:F-box/LRR-repeat protein 15-like n=1 Tax=Haliotis rufescens TaxID=6454 RepID=UPI001EB05B5B|nr:F-box/LRR-repeat protein 15-like [Haliotis rufescens]
MATADGPVTFFSLPWEHVICRHLFPFLSVKEVFQLRVISTQFRDIVDTFFRTTFTLDLSRVAARVTSEAFVLMSHNNLCLKKLTLINSKDWLSDTVLKPVLLNNPYLLKVDLTNCSNLTNLCVNVLAVNCHALQLLVLRDCHWVSKEALTGLLVNCRELEHVDLTGCWNLDDEVISQLIVYGRKIRYLSVSKIYGLTDTAISVISHNSPSLQHLNIHGCWRVTNDSIRLLGEFCMGLKALQIKDCRGINEISLARLRARGIKMDVPPPPQAQTLSYLHRNIHNLNVQI